MRQDSSSKVSCLFDDGLLEGVRRMVGLPSSQGMDGLNCTPGYGELVVTVGASDQLAAQGGGQPPAALTGDGPGVEEVKLEATFWAG